MNYIVLSPVGRTRHQYLEAFTESLKLLTPPPREIVFCVDLDSEIEINKDDITVRYSPEMSCYHGELKRICTAREILRKHFIYHKDNYELALWIDSDIIVPPETPIILKEKMDEKNCLIVVNKYDGRNNGQWCGSGVMLTHRHACTASRFWVGNIYDENGVEKHLSEDFVFFAIFDQGRGSFERLIGKQGRICDEYVKVNHLMEKRNVE